MTLSSIITEQQYEDRVCKCNNISRGQLLKEASFNSNYTPEEVMKSLVKKGCGCCMKSLEDWNNSSCKDKQELDVHYSQVIK